VRLGASVAAALAVLALAGLSACGDEDGEPQAAGVGEARLGSVAPLALCRDWRAGDERQRRATIDDIRRQVNVRDTPTPTPELSDALAYEVFQDACAEEFAAGFRLYKIYARAAAFQSLR
jgi:hypothetical protein